MQHHRRQGHAVWSCRHVVWARCGPKCTHWCRSLLDQMQWDFYCPAIVDGKTKQCKKVWPYEEVRRLALLNEAETKYFEAKMSEYAAKTFCDMKECPGCRSFVERENASNLRVVCVVCTKKKGSPFEFCWNCDAAWSGPTTSAVKCCNSNCEHRDISTIRDAPNVALAHGTIKDVPSRRACPTCGYVTEHDTTGCKYMLCQRCRKEYCFACLQMKAQCIKTSNYFIACSRSVAPVQTSIPVWNR